VYREQNGFRERNVVPDFARGVEPVQQRHRQIEDGDVRLEFARQPHRLPAVGSFRENVNVLRFALEQQLDPLPHHRLVVCQDYSDGHAAALRCSGNSQASLREFL